MIEAVIFDFDGVLYDSEPLHHASYHSIFKDYAIQLSEEAYMRYYVGQSDQFIIADVLAQHEVTSTPEIIKQLTTQKIRAFQTLIHRHVSLPSKSGMHELLTLLKQNQLKIAICSSAARDEIQLILSKLEGGMLQSYFELITSVDDVTYPKPSPQPYQLTSQRLMTHVTQCLVIEDTDIGIRAAKAAGMQVAGLVGTLPPDRLDGADYLITEVKEVLAYLNSAHATSSS